MLADSSSVGSRAKTDVVLGGYRAAPRRAPHACSTSCITRHPTSSAPRGSAIPVATAGGPLRSGSVQATDIAWACLLRLDQRIINPGLLFLAFSIKRSPSGLFFALPK